MLPRNPEPPSDKPKMVVAHCTGEGCLRQTQEAEEIRTQFLIVDELYQELLRENDRLLKVIGELTVKLLCSRHRH